MAFSPDGTLIASGGGDTDYRVLIWDVSNGDVLHTLRGHPENVYQVIFSPEGSSMVLGGIDGKVRVGGVASGQHVTVLIGHRGEIYLVAFSPVDRIFTTRGEYGKY
jgi:WD40 repeat protein